MRSHAIAYLGVRALNGALALASLFVLTRLLEPAQYGRYALALAGVAALSTLLFQWLCVGLARFHASRHDDPGPLLSEAGRLFVLLATAALALVATAAALAAAVPWPAITPAMCLAVGVATVALAWHNLHLQIANARQEPRRYGAITAGRAALALLASAGLVWAGGGGLGAVWGLALGCVVAVLVFGVRVRIGPTQPALRRELVHYGMPMVLTYVGAMLIDVSDRMIIGAWHGAATVAGYAAAYDLSQQTVSALLNVFLLAGFPVVAHAWERGGAPSASVALAAVSRGVVTAGAALAALFAAGADEIAAVVFGAGVRAQAASLMPWAAGAIALAGMRAFALDIAFQVSGRTRLQAGILLVVAAVNLVLNLALVPTHGALGAAQAAVLAHAAGVALAWWHGRALVPLPSLPRDTAKALACAASMYIALRWAVTPAPSDPTVSLHDLYRGLAGLAAYAAAALALDLCGVRTRLRARARESAHS